MVQAVAGSSPVSHLRKTPAATGVFRFSESQLEVWRAPTGHQIAQVRGRGPGSSGTGSRRRPSSATRRCWRKAERSPPTTSPAAGSNWGSGRAGGIASTRHTASTCPKWGRGWNALEEQVNLISAADREAGTFRATRGRHYRAEKPRRDAERCNSRRLPLILGGKAACSLRLAAGARRRVQHGDVDGGGDRRLRKPPPTRPAKRPRPRATRRPCRSRCLLARGGTRPNCRRSAPSRLAQWKGPRVRDGRRVPGRPARRSTIKGTTEAGELEQLSCELEAAGLTPDHGPAPAAPRPRRVWS